MKTVAAGLGVAVALGLSGCDQLEIWKAEAAVKTELRDPYSAKFTQVEVRRWGICGYVNAKNIYGAYAGPELFAYARGKAVILTRDEAYHHPETGGEKLKFISKACLGQNWRRAPDASAAAEDAKRAEDAAMGATSAAAGPAAAEAAEAAKNRPPLIQSQP